MATVYSNIATIENAPTPGTLMDPNIVRGKVRVVSGSYAAASLAASSVVRLCKLYAGDVVLMGPSWFGTEDTMGSGVTVKIGDDDDTTAADDDRYVAATALASAAIVQFNDAVTCINKRPYVIQKECWLIATFSAEEITGDLRFEVHIANAG
jgi:hypothetical protein